jgi:hypothetical protein
MRRYIQTGSFAGTIVSGGTVVKQFEYFSCPTIFDKKELNNLGKNGWELVIAQPGGMWIFKREMEPLFMEQAAKDVSGKK